MSSCCGSSKETKTQTSSCDANTSTTEMNTKQTSACCPTDNKKTFDWLLWGSTGFVAIAFLGYWLQSPSSSWLYIISETSVEMLHAMWIGMALGVVVVGWLNRIPRDVIIATLGKGNTKRGLFRATLAGLFFDLCNHGILMVGMKLYERGASLGQVMAFIIASPWNSVYTHPDSDWLNRLAMDTSLYPVVTRHRMGKWFYF